MPESRPVVEFPPANSSSHWRRLAVVISVGISILLCCINSYLMFSIVQEGQTLGPELVWAAIAFNALGCLAILATVILIVRPACRAATQTQRLFESAHTQSVMPKAWLDTEGRFIRVNEAFCKFVGRAETELLGTMIGQVLPSSASVDGSTSFLADGDWFGATNQREVRFTNENGTPVTGLAVLSALRDDRGENFCYFLCIVDVTTRSQVEKDLRASEARFRAITACSPLGIFLTDSLGQCTFANDVYLRLTGLHASEARGEGWVRSLHPEDRETVLRLWTQFAKQGGEFDHQFRYKRADKTVVWVRVLAAAIREDQKVIGYIGMVENVTSQRERDIMVRESEKRFRKLADSVPALIWMDDNSRRGSYINKAWINYTGNAELGDAWKRSVYPDDLERYLQLSSAAWDRREMFRLEYRLRRRDGVYRWFVVTAIPLLDEDGVFSGYIGSCVDIHDSKVVQQQLQDAKERAEAASIAKSNFLANISHEFRTPMTTILGYAELLESPKASDLTQQECISSIKTSGQHLLAMLNDILDLSKVEAGELAIVPAPCDIARVCTEVVDMMKPRALEKGLEFGVRLLPPLPHAVETDAIRLKQILVNLVGNAIKFTDEGKVKLTVSANLIETKVLFTFVVADTGMGIRPEQIDRLFTPFFQADDSSTRRHGGTGLGLAISRRLAQRLGGDLVVQSDGKSGSVFTFTLSANVSEAALPVSAPDQPAEPSGKLGRVLIAEDGASTRRLLDAILRRAGADVVTCEDGQTAFELALEQRFDVVVLDMLMPELDGYTVARMLRARGCRTPIIALTANAMSGDRERCIANGCDDYLPKPIDRDHLISTIARYCGAESKSARLKSISTDLSAATMGELRKAFFTELAGEHERLEEKLRRADVVELKRALHQIKGGSAAFGFDDISRLAAEAEQSIGEARRLDPQSADKIGQLLAIMRAAMLAKSP